jgi:hypothetical protein
VAKVTQVWANEEGLLLGLPRNPHTPTVANMEIYRLNGYGASWRISGDVLVHYLVPANEVHHMDAERVTIHKAKLAA